MHSAAQILYVALEPGARRRRTRRGDAVGVEFTERGNRPG
jgi:hypothetical protein